LAAVAERIPHGTLKAGTEGMETAARGALVPQVDESDVWQGTFEHAVGQAQERVLATLRVVPAFQRRGRRAQKDGAVLQPCTHDGDIAGMVARRRFLLEGS